MKSLGLCVLFLVTVSAFTPPTLPNPEVTLKEMTPGRKLLEDKSAAQLEFWIAVNKGDVEGMRKAKEAGADPEDKTEPSGYRPIHLAASIGNPGVVLVLLEYGVDVNAQTNNGTTALHYAANHGDAKVLTILLTAGADPNIADHRGFVPLHFASYANMSIVVQASAEMSKTASVTSKTTTTGMGEFLACVEILLSFSAKAGAATFAKETPLHYTPAFDQFQISELLIDAGADVNALDAEKETPLHEATAYGAIGVTQLLLKHNADASLKEEEGHTPEQFVCHCRSYKDDPTMTQCAPGKCTASGYDERVINHVFAVYNGNN